MSQVKEVRADKMIVMGCEAIKIEGSGSDIVRDMHAVSRARMALEVSCDRWEMACDDLLEAYDRHTVEQEAMCSRLDDLLARLDRSSEEFHEGCERSARELARAKLALTSSDKAIPF